MKGMPDNIYDRLERHLNIWPNTAYAYGHSSDGKTVDQLVLYIQFEHLVQHRKNLQIPFYFDGHYIHLNNSDK